MGQRAQNRLTKIGIYAIILVFVAVSIFPFIIMLSTSFKTLAELRAEPYRLIPETFHFENYVNSLKQGSWGTYFFNSFYITIFTTGISLLTNSLAGYAFSRLEFKGRELLFRFSLIGMMIPLQVVMIPIFLRIKEMPLMGGNDIFGVGGTGLLNTRWGIIAPLLAGPFGVFLCRQFFLNFPRALDDAARIDGCSRFRAFFVIYLPLAKPVLATLAILKATDSWNQYTWPLIITNSDKLRTVQLALSMYRGMDVVQWDMLMPVTVLICIPVLVLFLCLQKYYVQGIVSSGIKG